MKRSPFSIRDINSDKAPLGDYALGGWVRTHRHSKSVSFIELTDGSSVKGLQLVVGQKLVGSFATRGLQNFNFIVNYGFKRSLSSR